MPYFSESPNFVLPEQEISFEGTIIKEPELREDKTRIVLKSKEFGKTLVFASRYPEFGYGDRVRIRGRVEKPPVFKDFDYKKYLEKQGIFSLVYNPEITILEKDSLKGPYSYILSFKDELRQRMEKIFSPPKSHILGAMLLGDKGRMPESLKEKLNIAGLRHITAISGMHIIILSGILMSVFSFFVSSKKAFLFTFLTLFLFLVMVGLPYSGIRAGIMAFSISFARIIGRKSANIRILVFAAAIMLAFNPLLLFYDAGFQLSFLAAAGIVYFKEPVKNFLRGAPFKDILAMTLSAQIFTLPILIYNFGRVSLVAPLSNVLAVPILPFLMIFGFLTLAASLISLPLALLVSFPGQALLGYLTNIIDFFSDKPWAFKEISGVHWFWIFSFYFSLLLFAYWRKKTAIKKGPEF